MDLRKMNKKIKPKHICPLPCIFGGEKRIYGKLHIVCCLDEDEVMSHRHLSNPNCDRVAEASKEKTKRKVLD